MSIERRSRFRIWVSGRYACPASRTYLHVYVYSTAIEYIGYRSERGNARNNRKCACTYIYTYL